MSDIEPKREVGPEKVPSVKNLDMEIQLDYTPEEERRVLRKIDRVVLALMCLVQFFQCK